MLAICGLNSILGDCVIVDDPLFKSSSPFHSLKEWSSPDCDDFASAIK
jgi:hypothetical protein